ncbi:MAG TPA: peroxiredoxin [Rhodocyclaceae bacterium]|nr:peroxiredoxin [Rhodocyclaceae bacterium]
MRWLMMVLLGLLPVVVQADAVPTVGSQAPAFSLPDQGGAVRRLEDWRGKWTVLYFYPKDETSGCTVEAQAFRDAAPQLAAMNAVVAGVSLDDVASHLSFAKNHQLNFPLLADTDGAVARRYGTLLNLGVMKFAKRISFIIDPEGRVAKVYPDVDPVRHARDVLADLKLLAR